MGRYYRLSKKLSEDVAAEALRELREVDDIKKAEITGDSQLLLVEAKDGIYTDAMYAAVNIFSRVANCELSFERFDAESAG